LSSSSEASIILAPPSAVRQSSRKRAPKSYTDYEGSIFEKNDVLVIAKPMQK
jgi:hypothetical protein